MDNYIVFVVDDHTLLAQAIAQMVNSFANFKCTETCINGKALIEKLAVTNNSLPQIILMDVNMPIMNGVETTQYITQNYPQCKVLALSVEDDDLAIVNMLKAGAIGYLLKDTEKSILENAMNQVIKQGFYHTKKVTQLLVKNLTSTTTSISLSEKELMFLKLVCEELTYKEIADKMCLSPKTIDGYREQLFVKCDVKNRIGLVIYAVKNKIYTP